MSFFPEDFKNLEDLAGETKKPAQMSRWKWMSAATQMTAVDEMSARITA